MDTRLRHLGLTLVLGVAQLCAPGLTKAAVDPVQFDRPIVIEAPQVITGDAGDGRCAPAGTPCLKDVDDLLYGRTHILRSDDLALTSDRTLSLVTTQNSAVIPNGTQTQNLAAGATLSPLPRVVGARLFNTRADTAVTLIPTPGGTAGVLRWRLDGLAGPIASGDTQYQPFTTTGVFALAADVNGDGFDEVVIWLRGTGASNFGGGLIATAVDPQDPAKGLRFGTFLLSQTAPLGIAKVQVAGQPRIIVVGNPPQAAACFEHGHTGLRLDSFAIDPKTLTISTAGTFSPTLTEGSAICLTTAGITAGRFSTATHDQLAVVYGGRDGTIKVLPFDLDGQGNLLQQPAFDTTYVSGGQYGGNAEIASGRFDWTSPLEQVALLVSNCFTCTGVNTARILSFGPTFQAQPGPVIQAAGTVGVCDGPLAVGNFDRQKTNPQAPPATLPNPNLQLAIPFTDCEGQVFLRIFDVDPGNSFALALSSGTTLVPGGSAIGATITPLDLQGRSMRVGRPDIVTINSRQQATLQLAAPPMHVDAVVPTSGGDLRPFNITGTPQGFNSSFSYTDSNSDKTSTTSDLTWSFSAKESYGETFTAGDCELGDCAQAGFKASAQQALDGSKSALSGSYSSVSNSLSYGTDFSDLLSFQTETLTIYVYPLVGRSVCPNSTPNCTDAQKVPLIVNLAGPDTVNFVDAAPGALYPWYQPVWIPGNLLSYPGTANQMKAAAFADPADFVALSADNSWDVGVNGIRTESIEWNQGHDTGNTSTFKQNYSFETEFSASGKVGLDDILTGEVSASLDLSGSFGFSNLTDALKTLNESQGIQIALNSTFRGDPSYVYRVRADIFGKKKPATVVDDTTLPADLQVFGALRTGFEVDLNNGGTFWSAWYGKAPDLALNQPVHWNVQSTGRDGGSDTCLTYEAGSSNYDCLTLGLRLPSAHAEPIWESAFHYMRGLFITGPSGTGPQLTTATTGDQLLLTARVYNLSMADLGTARIHVRFMAMPWDARTQFNVPAGPSFQIGEQVLNGVDLPPYNTNTDRPNWTLAAQTFDTSGAGCGGQPCDNLDLLFWVVVWAEDAEGRLLGELPQHGLASVPAAGEDFLAVAAREQSYSNNLGLYNQVFHVFPKNPALRAPTPAAGEIGAAMTLAGSAVRELPRGQSTPVAVKVDTGGRDLNGGLQVDFYDGNPKAGGTLIGLQRLPYLAADSLYDFRVSFHSQVCGLHTVYAVAGAGTRHAHTVAFKPIEVLCNDLAKLGALIAAKSGTQGQRTWTIALSNTGAAVAHDARVTGLKLTQTYGAACTPVIKSPAAFPLPVGNIAPGATANGAVTIDFTGCASAARFRAELGFGSDHGIVTGTMTLNNQFR